MNNSFCIFSQTHVSAQDLFTPAGIVVMLAHEEMTFLLLFTVGKDNHYAANKAVAGCRPRALG